MKLREDEPAPGTVDGHGDGRGDGRGPRRPDPHQDRGPDGRRTLATRFREQPLLNTLLVLACVALIILGFEAVGPSSSSSGQATRTATAKDGVVQSTVSGSGNIQSADELNLGFKTSGTVTHIYVKEGQHVTQGQLLATLDPSSAEVTLEQAKASLQSAEANLAKLEETEGETSGSQGSSGTGTAATTASTSSVSYATEAAAYTPTTTTAEPTGETPATGTGTSTSTTPATTTTTTPSASPKKSGKRSSGAGQGSGSTPSTQNSQATEATTTSTPASSTTTKQSAATREANLASAKAAVKSDKLSVQSAEQAVGNTKLYSPESGTVVTLSGEVGETVSGTGTSKASSSSSSSSTGSSSTGAAATGKGSAATGASTTAASSSTGGSSSSSFAVLSNLESLQVVVPLSESEIGNVHEGQIATVTIEALNRKVAAHVSNVGQVPTSSSGAVSYDVTFQLDQGAEGLKVGMSATAEVVVHQAEGVNVPTSAIKADTVTIVKDGKHVTQRVTTGLAGNSSTIVLSGLNAGEEVLLPSVSTSRSSTSLTSKLGSRLGRTGGLGGGGFAGGGGGFAGGGPP